MNAESINSVYTFGPFRLEVQERRLVRQNSAITLTGKAFETLRVLVERHGSLVSKNDLMAAVWPETTVEENNLDRNISAVRKALGQKIAGPQYIETVPRVGYRFVAQVSEFADGAAASASPTQEISAIAVLPFADMSPARDQDYLCEGLAEEIINALAQVDGLRVASRTASFQFRAPGADVRAVGQQLGVGTLLEGSVRKMDDCLRVTVQLIEVASGFHRWSRRFDRKFDDVFAIQDEIAERVATSLRGNVLSQLEKQAMLRPQTGAAAYEYYLRGRQYLPRLTEPDLQRSGEMFEQAIALDAHYDPLGGVSQSCTPRSTNGSAHGNRIYSAPNAPAKKPSSSPLASQNRTLPVVSGSPFVSTMTRPSANLSKPFASIPISLTPTTISHAPALLTETSSVPPISFTWPPKFATKIFRALCPVAVPRVSAWKNPVQRHRKASNAPKARSF
jgi:TolB-like protein